MAFSRSYHAVVVVVVFLQRRFSMTLGKHVAGSCPLSMRAGKIVPRNGASRTMG